MKRREFIALVGGAAIGWPVAAVGQQLAAQIARIGMLAPASGGPRHFGWPGGDGRGLIFFYNSRQ